MASDHSEVKYACRCLNVRVTASQPPTPPPDYTRDPDYTPVFVKDDGISVTHPQVTVRLSSKGVPIPGTTKCSRFTALTCLFCNLAIYRVHHIISLDVEGTEMVLLPSEEWVEHEIMKSANGWIDIHKDSLVGEAIVKAESSPSYVPYFSLVLPPNSSSPLSSPKMDAQDSLSSEPSTSEAPPQAYLSHLGPLFLPPPFTSSHPIFVHLAALATKESEALRAAAEQRISDFVKAETAGIEVKEKELRRQTETLWKKFREHLNAIQQDRHRPVNHARSPSRGRDHPVNGLISPTPVSASVTIRSFVPQPVSPAPVVSSSTPRVSALSASLATTRFHHPRETQGESSSTTQLNGSNHSSSSTLSTPRSVSSTLVPSEAGPGSPTVLQFKRNINDTINTQASFRYFLNLDEDMARYKRQQEEVLQKQREAEMAKGNQTAGPSQDNGNPSTNGTTRSGEVKAVDPMSPTAEGTSKPEGETKSSRGRDKGKRKVTFDAQPAVVTITEEDAKVDEESRGIVSFKFRKKILNTDLCTDMIFPLEDLEGVDKADKPTDTKNQTLPLLEQPATRPFRVRSVRQQNNTAMEAFSSLRPSSLPNPSHIRPIRSQPGVDSSSHMMSLPRAVTTPARLEGRPRTSPPASPSSPLTEHEEALLKLVAADTPSHRGAWTRDSKLWQAFIRRQDLKADMPSADGPDDTDSTDEEPEVLPGSTTKPRDIKHRTFENEESSSRLPISGSLPINIKRRLVKEPLSLASYLPPSAMPEQAAQTEPSTSSTSKPLSSAAIRKAAYAERDRSRSMDPGALDFATVEEEDEDDVEDESEPDPAKPESHDAGEKGRKRALKILQARSELPEEGMWRSLA
ncbi:hypothetical protein CVT26_014628 [Gymnopilus dilepis]|uniref:Uncharacterized protein n=1 Tax=Gymnopilus dilepis TaxID=231916 RepID=A0A409VWR2_9AGAR|nr:hypothetical protein CVT26_014628 [Gymnopilus dilepis]